MEGNYQNQNQYDQGTQTSQYSSNYQDNTANIPYQPSAPDRGAEGTNGLQIAGLVCGILSIRACCCYGIPSIILGVAGLICSIIGNNQSKSGVGVAGLVCSIVGLILGAISSVFYIWAFYYVGTSGDYQDLYREIYRELYNM